MRLFIGETSAGIPLEPEGYVAVCRRAPDAGSTLLYGLDQMGTGAPRLPDYDDDDEEEEEEEEGEGADGAASASASASTSASGVVDEGEEEFAQLMMAEDGEEGEAEAEDAEAAALALRECLIGLAAVGPPGITEEADDVPRPQRVWVLMGGDAGQATASLRSGLEVVRRLGQFNDLQVGLRWGWV